MRLLLLTLVCICATSAERPATLDLHVENAPLATLIERIARQCDAGLAVDASAMGKLTDAISLRADEATWEQASALLADQYGIAIDLIGDRLHVTSADAEFRKRLVMRFYDIRTLTAGMTAFPGPELTTPQAGDWGSRMLPPIEDTAPPELNEFIEIARTYVAPASWDRGGVSIEEYGGSMVIIQTPEAHADLADLLIRLEAGAARQLVCRVYEVGGAIPEGAVIDQARWNDLLPRAGQPIGVAVMRDGQQNNFYAASQRAVITEADIVSGVTDPVVTVIGNGISVDVRPQLTIGGVVAEMRLQATRSQSFTSSDLNNAGGETIVAIAKPANDVVAIGDTRLIPAGGAALYRVGDRTIAVAFEVHDYAADGVLAPAPGR